MNKDIEVMIQNCSFCATYLNKQQKEPLQVTSTPEYPYQMFGCDIFGFKGINYIISVDYYSKFLEVDQLKDLRSSTVISAKKSQFCRCGIPEVLRSDSGTQFMSCEFRQFCKEYEISHKPSSLHYQ